MRRLTALFIALVFAHLLVVLVHTVAHLELQIIPPPTDTVFILGVILIGPVAALPILRFNRPLASGLLIVVMAAAFAYGFQSHFVIPGPDQVSNVTSAGRSGPTGVDVTRPFTTSSRKDAFRSTQVRTTLALTAAAFFDHSGSAFRRRATSSKKGAVKYCVIGRVSFRGTGFAMIRVPTGRLDED